MDILSEIIAHKRTEVELQKQSVSPEQLREQVQKLMGSSSVPRHSMRQALASSPTGIIAEFKRRSPSKGWIYETAKAEEIPAAYETAGASALSILTDEKFFGGSLRDISTARPLVDIPILRKDFIIDEYQLLQARIVGADAVLLIAACLTQKECTTLTTQAHALGLEVLLEIHNPSELPYINKEVDMLGVNNRNLGTFVTDVKNSFRIARQLQQAIGSKKGASDVRNMPILVSESGISHPETIRSLRAAGFRGFLIGEAFMKTDHPGDTLKDFISPIISQK
ncbi:indole-3-glycerol phosphate synthase TrpC [Bacteroides eggerthii]|uniref:indole-3-glycerol-phosphate synthase n=1 Tax=Bacteroides eggerthii TaxID=28111 RepID=A0A7X9SER9_9BACE|nr:indole-3-glycerol phosphate synthase TrpC [Bacteroides eggerthii]NME87984.1 indole-3-glycerol phosphate synthase TrpC [Bacteroides eggerthii]